MDTRIPSHAKVVPYVILNDEHSCLHVKVQQHIQPYFLFQ